MGSSNVLGGLDGPVVICVGVPTASLVAVIEAAEVPVVFLPDAATLLAGLDPARRESHRVAECGKLRLDADLREASWFGRGIPLPAREFDLLFALTSDQGRIWTFADLTVQVWGRPYVGDAQAVTSAVKRLRRLLRQNAPGVRLESVRGIGYRLVVGDPVPNQADWPWSVPPGG
ncbi:MAG TPA: winged helix-turn-helix domain-containing protein [Actinokineospora sp.]|jgi:DNA-binding response OmpR family regulator|nr:winged helix-turn-helix domain-containing protein [Actinokineospora sp.]